MKKLLYLFLAVALLFIVTACGRNTSYHERQADMPSRSTHQRARHRRVAPSASRRDPITRNVTSTESRAERRATARGAELPDTRARHYEPAPHAMQPIPHMPGPGVSNTQAVPPAHTRHVQSNPPAQTQQPQAQVMPSPQATVAHSPVPSSAPAANRIGESIAGPELASHKTEFDAKDDARATNITKASSSINGHVVQPGELFSYNKTVGPTIERRGYKEGTIFVQGEKKKGFGGGVCQVSTTLSIAADEAGMTIIERHDHSLPVSYAKEGEEAATSYGGIDFKFKNEKPHPVVIRSTVEGGTITVRICKG